MIVTFAGYDIKVGTPVVSQDGAEVGSVDSTIGEDLVVNITGADNQMLLTESGVAAFEPDFIRLGRTAAQMAAGEYDVVGATAGGDTAAQQSATAEPATEESLGREPAASEPAGDTSPAAAFVADDAPAPGEDEPGPNAADLNAADLNAADLDESNRAEANPAEPARAAFDPADSGRGAADGGQTIHLHAEDLVAAKRQMATGVVKVSKRVVVDDHALDVDVFQETATVNRIDLDEEVGDDYSFEEGIFEIELTGETVEVNKRVRRVGQVQVGKERTTRTERVTGQTRREEVDVDEQTYDDARPAGDSYDPIVAPRLTDTN